jgi:signal peptidase
MPARAGAQRKSHIKNPRSGTSVFSRLWRFPAAKSMLPNFSADSTGIVLSFLISMPHIVDAPGDPKVGLVAELLRGCGTLQLKVWGTSMLPSIWPGDQVTIQSVVDDEVVPGDIVLVLRDDRFFVHRLVERRLVQDCLLLIMRGDAMPHNDPPAAASQLLGRVTRIRRGNRSLVPNCRVPVFQSALAWVLCYCNRFRNLLLRLHAARLQGVHCALRTIFLRRAWFSAHDF